jgi:hypothetical protein
MNNLPVVEGAQAAMEVVDRLQRHTPEARVLGAFAVVSLMADAAGLTPQEIITAATNLMNHAQGRRPEFAAVQEYIEKEMD